LTTPLLLLLLLLLPPRRPGRYQHDSFCSWGPVPESDVWQVMLKLNSMPLQLVEQYRQYWQQQQKQQQQQQELLSMQQQQQKQKHGPHSAQQQQQQQHGVSWAAAGFLAVNSGSGRRVPGLQLNLAKHTRHQLTKLQPTTPAHTAAAAEQIAAEPTGDMAAAGTAADKTEQRPTLTQLPDSSRNSLSSSSSSSSAQADGSCAGHITVITVSHFLPHPQLPHSRFSELSKAMGCQELQLQLQQVRRRPATPCGTVPKALLSNPVVSVITLFGPFHRCIMQPVV
jgi:hypothetical protein